MINNYHSFKLNQSSYTNCVGIDNQTKNKLVFFLKLLHLFLFQLMLYPNRIQLSFKKANKLPKSLLQLKTFLFALQLVHPTKSRKHLKTSAKKVK